MVLICKTLNFIHPNMLYAKFGWKGPMVLQKKIFRFCFFVIISPWKRMWHFIWTNLNPIHPRMVLPSLVEIGPIVLEKKILSMYFRYFVICSLWIRAWPFILTNLNPFHPRMFCAKFGRNLPSGSGEEDENVKSLQKDGRTPAPSTQW